MTMTKPSTGSDAVANRRRVSVRPLLGTFCVIETAESGHERAISAGFSAIERVQRVMNPHLGDSDLRRLRDSPVCSIVTVDAWTIDVLRHAKTVHNLSGGLFDPCLPTDYGTLTDIELVSETQLRCHAPVELDLGGIAKGFAVDRAVDALRHAGADAGLVNAGGDVRVFGLAPKPIVLRPRCAEDRPQTVLLADAALAVSDLDVQQPPTQHQGYYTRLSSPTAARRYVAIRAGTAVIADALTKCAIFSSADALQSLLDSLDAQLIACIPR